MFREIPIEGYEENGDDEFVSAQNQESNDVSNLLYEFRLHHFPDCLL